MGMVGLVTCAVTLMNFPFRNCFWATLLNVNFNRSTTAIRLLSNYDLELLLFAIYCQSTFLQFSSIFTLEIWKKTIMKAS